MDSVVEKISLNFDSMEGITKQPISVLRQDEGFGNHLRACYAFNPNNNQKQKKKTYVASIDKLAREMEFINVNAIFMLRLF